MITKVVIPAAGLGTRLLPITKETPKEMLPIYMRGDNGSICLKPMLQAVFEQLHSCGFKEFCFIVGRGKRAIEDHFTQDSGFVNHLKGKNKRELAEEMESFYRKISDSSIVFVNQPEPRGFGDAVLKAKPFVSEDFLVHAGDTYIISNEGDHIKRLISAHLKLRGEATFVSQEVEDPRQYGVAMVEKIFGENVLRVKKVIEKPQNPTTKLAVMPIYVFNPVIFEALQTVSPGVGGEIQLTDGIQRLIDQRRVVQTITLSVDETRLDIGNPESCWQALNLSYHHYSGRRLS